MERLTIMIKEWIIKTYQNHLLNYGFSVGGAWKGLSVDLFFQGVAGGKRFYDQRTEWEGMELPHMHGGQIIGHRRTQMPSSQGQEPTTELPKNRLLDSRYFILRLKNVNITYQLPQQSGIQMGAFTNEIHS